MEQQLFDYIKRTQFDSSPAKEYIVIDGKKSCSIHKGGNPKPQVTIGAYPITFQWEEDSKQEMCKLLHEALNTKSKKLSHISLPIILLLLDENHFLETAYYGNCTSVVSLLQQFHTVFVINPFSKGEEDLMLYTSSTSWGKRGK